jgi:prevent-host-death family protein
MKSLPVSQTREALADVIAELGDGPVEITRHGEAIAYMVSPDMYNKLVNPPSGHVFSTDKIRPATKTVEELLAMEPIPYEGDGPTLSEILEELREERL